MDSNDSSVLARVRQLVRSRNGPRYQQVGLEGNATRYKSQSRSKKTIVVLVIVILVSTFYVFGHRYRDINYGKSITGQSMAPPKFFSLLVDAPVHDTNLCKAMISAAVLDYPGAYMIGWKETLEEQKAVLQLGLYEKTLQVQHLLEKKADDDLVLIIDGYRTWFQLRPQTLIDRYFEINHKANQRLRKEFGEEVVKTYSLEQHVVFGSQKICSPWATEDPACYAVPDTTLPTGIYDSLTASEDEGHSNGKDRQRFLNAGTIVGTAKAMRALYKEATYRITQDDTLVSDQQVFSSIFGEQEVHRELLKRESRTWRQSVSSMFSKDPRAVLFKPEHLERAKGRGQAIELGIGLDYESQISFATQSAHGDVEWTTFSGRKNAAGTDKKNSHVKSIQSDVASTVPPFWTPSNERAPRNLPWEDVPLLMNTYTGITPAVIEHNGPEALREDWWGKMWFQKHARILYNAHVHTPQGALAVSGTGPLREYWNQEDYRGGVRNETGWWFRYDEICEGTDEEVFRDGLGRWWLPADH